MLYNVTTCSWKAFSLRFEGQRRGEMDYEERLKILNWPTLEKRRHFISLVFGLTVFGLNGFETERIFFNYL